MASDLLRHYEEAGCDPIKVKVSAMYKSTEQPPQSDRSGSLLQPDRPLFYKTIAHSGHRLLVLIVFCLYSTTQFPAFCASIHLAGPTPEWSIFEGRTPHGPELRQKMMAARNPGEHTLFIRQDDVKQDWTVTLNGQKLGSLFLMEADLLHTLPIPANLLRDGENEIHIFTKAPEDILVHDLSIAAGAKASLLSGGPLTIQVQDDAGINIPARLTIVDTNGTLTALHESGGTHLAVRPGVVYTGDGIARVSLLPGKYTIFATRGPEYSLAKKELTVAASTPQSVTLTLTREVDTTSWIASDTHIHTLTLSKHGDALLAERLLTLAGEAIELPIATEHNLHADYLPAARRAGLDKYFTAVAGNEVTTKKGHFNVFPVPLSAPPADHSLEAWPELLSQIRQSPEIRVAILNHPTDTHSGFTPFAATNLNLVTGKNLRGNFEFTFDAVEVINSGAMRSDWMEPFRAWFALVNRGHKIMAIGSSDSHDVSRFIVGQGRTYIQGKDADPSKLDVRQACENLKNGRSIVSLGLFPQLAISAAPDALSAPELTTGMVPARASGPGDLHTSRADFIEVHATVDFPVWMNPAGRTIATLYANGRPKIVFPFETEKRRGQPLGFKARLPKPKADTWYVLIAQAPGVTNSYWAVARPYQPASREWEPVMIGATNPIWLDADHDGRFSAPRATAARLFKKHTQPTELIEALDAYDWAVAVHSAELLHESQIDAHTHLQTASPELQQAFADFNSSILKP